MTITNVSNQTCQLEIPLDKLQLGNPNLVNTIDNNYWYDLIGNQGFQVQQQRISIVLHPYDVVLLAPYKELERNIENRSR